MLVPGGTRVTLDSEHAPDSQMMLPAASVIELPHQKRNQLARSKTQLFCEGQVREDLGSDFFVNIPNGSRVEVPQGEGLMRVTVVPGSTLQVPMHQNPSNGDPVGAHVQPGQETKIPETVVPKRLILLGGTTVILPPPISVEPKVIAQRMQEFGPEAVSAAIGGMDPFAAAESLEFLQVGLLQND